MWSGPPISTSLGKQTKKCFLTLAVFPESKNRLIGRDLWRSLVWPPTHFITPLVICTQWEDPPQTLPSPCWTVPSLSAFPHRTDASVPSSSPWPFIGLSPVCPCLFCSGEPRTGHSSQTWCHQCGVEGRVTSFNLLATPLSMQLWRFLTFFATILHC